MSLCRCSETIIFQFITKFRRSTFRQSTTIDFLPKFDHAKYLWFLKYSIKLRHTTNISVCAYNFTVKYDNILIIL